MSGLDARYTDLAECVPIEESHLEVSTRYVSCAGRRWRQVEFNKLKNYVAGAELATWQADLYKPQFFYTTIKDLGDDDSHAKGQHRAMMACGWFWWMVDWKSVSKGI
jgi:hypothetical protein